MATIAVLPKKWFFAAISKGNSKPYKEHMGCLILASGTVWDLPRLSGTRGVP
jgi:hypothetical protein